MDTKRKPIEQIHIFASGDSSVGIQSTSYTMEVYIDPATISRDEKEELDEIRAKVSEFYETFVVGEHVTVLFDYELEELNRQEAAMEEQMDEDELRNQAELAKMEELYGHHYPI